MKKLFLMCFNGITEALTEDGDRMGSAVMYGFTQEPYEEQKNFIIETFKNWEKKYSKEYEIVYAKSFEEKQALKEAIKKQIEYNKKKYSNDNWEWWEKWSLQIDGELFDKHNANLVEAILWLTWHLWTTALLTSKTVPYRNTVFFLKDWIFSTHNYIFFSKNPRSNKKRKSKKQIWSSEE